MDAGSKRSAATAKPRARKQASASAPERAAAPAKVRTTASAEKSAARAKPKASSEVKIKESAGPTSAEIDTNTEHDVGRMLRQERRSKKLTLAQLAELAHVSTSYVSQVERGVANPTLASLKTLSNALGLSVGSLLDGSSSGAGMSGRPSASNDGEVGIQRAGARKRVILPGSHIANELLSPNLRVQMEVIWVEAPPGSGSGGHPHQHAGEECGIVISGAMRFWVGDQEWTLGPRDSIYFPSRLPHRFESAGPEDLVAIWIITPPTF